MLNEAGLKAAVEAVRRAMNLPDWEHPNELIIKAAITAYLASVQGEPVAVKKLEWRPTTDQLPNHAYETPTPFGRWLVVIEFVALNEAVYRLHGSDYSSLEAAKAAAQADFEARIRSTIITHPADRDGVEAGGWRTMETAPRSWDEPIMAVNSRHLNSIPVIVRWTTTGLDDDDEPHWCDAATASGEALYYNLHYFDYWQPLPTPPASALKGGA